MISWHGFRSAAALTLAFAALSHSAHAQGVACRRPAAKTFADGETIVLAESKQFPCRIAVVETPVVLRADDAGKIPNIGQNVYRGPDGKFFTYTSQGEFTVWNANGTFVRNIGRTGQGPGEFAIGPLSMHFDRKGQLYIRDNQLRWSIYSPTLEFVRTMPAVGMGFDPRRSVFLDDGTFMSVAQSGAPATSFFHVFDFGRTNDVADTPTGRGAQSSIGGPGRVKEFGPVPEAERAMTTSTRDRFIAYSGGTTFWAGPPATTGRGYELELWNTTGNRLRTIRREVPWYPKGADAPPARVAEGQPRPMQPAQVVGLHADSTGLLYTLLFVPKPGEMPPRTATPAERDAAMDALADLYIEVIDANAGVVLASVGPLKRSVALKEYASGLFERSRHGYRPIESPDGLPGMRIVEYRILAR